MNVRLFAIVITYARARARAHVAIVLRLSLEREAISTLLRTRLDDKAPAFSADALAGHWNYDYRFSFGSPAAEEEDKTATSTRKRERKRALTVESLPRNLLRNIRGKSSPVMSGGRSPFRSPPGHLTSSHPAYPDRDSPRVSRTRS